MPCDERRLQGAARDEAWERRHIQTFTKAFLGGDLGAIIHRVQGKVHCGDRLLLLDGTNRIINMLCAGRTSCAGRCSEIVLVHDGVRNVDDQ